MGKSALSGVGILAVLTFASGSARAEAPLTAGDTVMVVSSTVPGNGDLNPYGVARIQNTNGNLHAGNILVSNFNNSANIQGTGTTIVQISPRGSMSLFAQIDPSNLPGPCPGGVGLTTALVVLRAGWVIVGSLPTNNGVLSGSGCLIVLNSMGQPVETITDPLINGPWDMTATETDHSATLFVTNVLNGLIGPNAMPSANQATVLRIALNTFGKKMMPEVVEPIVVIGSGFTSKTDPAALVIGPTGVGLSRNGVLYVADTVSNRIAAIPDAASRQTSAGTGVTVSQNGSLNGPLGLAIGHQGDIVTVNGGDGNLVVTRPDGTQVLTLLLDSSGTPPGAGALFGLAFAPQGLFFVNDATNTLNVLR